MRAEEGGGVDELDPAVVEGDGPASWPHLRSVAVGHLQVLEPSRGASVIVTAMTRTRIVRSSRTQSQGGWWVFVVASLLAGGIT